MAKDRQKRRATPDAGAIAWRADYLRRLGELQIPTLNQDAGFPLLERGNSKIGLSGSFASSAFVWNLPAVVTCPGASAWCKCHCYNADARSEKFPVTDWARNWAWATERPKELQKYLVAIFKTSAQPTAVRIHSSGDFYSEEYIRLWTEVCLQCPKVKFWAYTRSWSIRRLMPALLELRALENVQLFASWDAGMPGPPQGWRRSIVQDGKSEDVQPLKFSLKCPEEDGRVSNCLNCGYCFERRQGHVVFGLH